MEGKLADRSVFTASSSECEGFLHGRRRWSFGRGRGVRLQRFKDGGLSDVKTFKGEQGLTWVDAGGRVFTQSMKDLAAWRGNRGDAGRVRPDRFLTNNKFGQLVANGKGSNGS